MKVCSVLFFAALVAVTTSHKFNFEWFRQEILPVWKNTAGPYINQCMCSSAASKDLVDGFFERGEFSTNPCFKCNIMCYGGSLSILSSSGVVDFEKLRTNVYGVDDSIAHKCGHLQHIDICEKSYMILNCIFGILTGRDPYPGTLKAKILLPFQQLLEIK